MLAEDVRQLRGFTDEVDRNAFVPWTLEQLTDQAAARGHVELVRLATDIRHRGQLQGVLQQPNRNASASTETANGYVIYPGGVWTALLVSPELHAAHGRSPWWLQFYNESADLARDALRDHGLAETAAGCAVPVPLTAGALREQVRDEVLAWLAHVGPLLASAREARRARAGEDASEDLAGAAAGVVLAEESPQDAVVEEQ